MHIVSHRLHAVRELHGIHLDEAIAVTFAVPAVVDINIGVARIAQPAFHHRIGNALDDVFRDVALKLVPCTPSHLWGVCQMFPFLCLYGHCHQDEHAAQNSHSAYSSHDFLFGIMIFLIIFAAKIQKIPHF